jgi:hypothetical protein
MQPESALPPSMLRRAVQHPRQSVSTRYGPHLQSAWSPARHPIHGLLISSSPVPPTWLRDEATFSALVPSTTAGYAKNPIVATARTTMVAATPFATASTAGIVAFWTKRFVSSLTRRAGPRASPQGRQAQRTARAPGHAARVARVEGARRRGPAGTRASRPVDAPPAQAMGGNGCKRERGWTDRRTPRRLEEGHGGHAQPAGRSAHRDCRRLPERRHASNLHPRRAYA